MSLSAATLLYIITKQVVGFNLKVKVTVMKKRPDYSGGLSLLSDCGIAAVEQKFWQDLGNEFAVSAGFPVDLWG